MMKNVDIEYNGADKIWGQTMLTQDEIIWQSILLIIKIVNLVLYNVMLIYIYLVSKRNTIMVHFSLPYHAIMDRHNLRYIIIHGLRQQNECL